MSTQSQINEDMLKEQMSAKAKQAAAVASAGKDVIQGAFLSTIKGASTPGEKAVIYGCLAGLVSFFLPWAALFGTVSANGWTLARSGSAWFWLHPASMLAVFLMSWALLNQGGTKRALSARWFVVIGTLWLAPGLILLSNIFSAAAGVGVYVATASAASILLGGFLQISQACSELKAVRRDSL